MTRISVLLTALLALGACETIKGAGQDIESAGQVIQDEAAETQADM